MFHVLDKVVYGMAGLRMLSSLIEMTGAVLMLYFGTASAALRVNASLALIGPFVLVAVTLLGVMGMADELEWSKIVWIVFGVGCILYGAKG